MGVDEIETLRALKRHRKDLINPMIAAYRGRTVKTTGDGMLVEFASVVDAISCGIAIQRGMSARNRDIPQERRIEFRVGINIGDIIVDEKDIYGDGVNVAARLEALAQPGGVCVSKPVRDQVRDKLAIGFDDLGEQTLKNIARPMRIFGLTDTNRHGNSLCRSGHALPAERERATRAAPLRSRLSPDPRRRRARLHLCQRVHGLPFFTRRVGPLAIPTSRLDRRVTGIRPAPAGS
jgi:class 3 adenylate cyclase